ncbi:SusC/RagA family TonB-linked outer membrane protein [Flavimarina sp. Hel_I_48]|uniref:SusC/RagA family TonB-linked outer membrane protein n=1 Tax=Flavimarina sp. Hel_I_48 TaxID=1392488 RepID=UPI00055F8960|nr:TonB-dependent receptor [Flavimarina sp. Hel_I_48]
MNKIYLFLFLLSSISAFSQKTITGQVVSSDMIEGIPGVSVSIKGENGGTITDLDGNYSIEVKSENPTLIFSYLGFKSQELPVGQNTVVDITLESDVSALSEVVVVGYGEQSKRNVTGAISSINMTDTEADIDITQSFSGVAGVQFNQTGRPGQVGNILIRGQNSLSGDSAPLIVLDGIIFRGSLNDINPQDIKSMEVLKDASSTAIYGSRAANGVILITSKEGTTEKPQFNINFNSGLSEPSSELKLLTGERYIERRLDWREQSGLEADPKNITQYLSEVEADNYLNGISRNPWDEIFQQGRNLTIDFSVSGRSEYVNYFLSASHSEDEGLVYNDNLKRNTLRSNIDIKLNDYLTVGTNTTFSIRDLSGEAASVRDAYRVSPFGNYYFPDGSPTQFPIPSEQAAVNPIRSAILTDNEEISNNLFSNFYAELTAPFVDGLSYRLNFSPNYLWNHNYNFVRQDVNVDFNNTSGSKYNSKTYNWFLENILKYNTDIGEDHNLDITLLLSRNHTDFESTTASAQRFSPDVLGYNNLGLGNSPVVSSIANAFDGVSYMARINYRLKNRYLLTFTTRRDGSSVFASNNKYATFPSGALAWIVSEEEFMQNLDFVDLLKFRVSYGAVGNQAIDPYQSLTLSDTRRYVFGNDGPSELGVVTSSLGNENLKWETTYTTNIGLDFELFKRRLSGSIEFYDSRTEDLLVRQTIPVSNGYNNVLSNIGEVNNRGIELIINSTNINSDSFNWSTNFSFSYNRNKIVHLFGTDINGDGREDDDISNSWFISKPIQSFYDYEFDGIYQEGDNDIPEGSQPGFVRVKDLNGDGEITPEDRTVVGSGGSPRYQVGITNSFSYKNLNLSFFINAMQGWEAPFNLINPLVPGRSLNQLDAGWWTSENQSNSRPSLTYSNPLGTNFYNSRDFVRIQDVTLGYDLDNSILSSLNLTKLRVYLNAKNLYTFTDWLGPDPENGGSYLSIQGSDDLYPIPTTISLGINVSF